jgi:hypothetical protein
MTSQVDPGDVLLYVKSEDHIRCVLPPDAHDEAIAASRASGYYTFWPGGWAGHATGSSQALYMGSLGNKPVLDKELPEDEVEAIRRVGAAIAAKSKRLHIVDVGTESSLRRYIEEHLHHLKRFPVLVRPDGRRLEGCDEFTDEKLESFLTDA